MSENHNADVNILSTIEGSLPENVSTFQNRENKEDSKDTSQDKNKTRETEAVNMSQDIEKVSETEVVSISQDVEKKEDPEDTSQNRNKTREMGADNISQDIEKVSEIEIVNEFQEREKTSETEMVSASQNLEKKEAPEDTSQLRNKSKETGADNISQDIEKESETGVVSELQDREKSSETEMVSAYQDLEKKEDSVTIDISQDIEKSVETEKVNTFEDLERNKAKAVYSYQDLKGKREPDVVYISEESEKIAETKAISTLEASEDSSESIHIRVSEPFSLTEDLELYLSESNSEDETKNVDCLSEPPLQDQNEEGWSKQKEETNMKAIPIVLEVSDQRTPDANIENPDKSKNVMSLIKSCSVSFPNLKDKIPINTDQVTDPEKQSSIHQLKRRGRPPKKKKTSVGSEDLSNKEVKPPKRNLRGNGKPVNTDFCEITKTINVPIKSCGKTNVNIKSKENLAREDLSSNTDNACKRNTVNIVTPRDLINQTLSKLMSGNFPRSQPKALDKGKKVVSGTLKELSVDKSEKVETSDQNIPGESNINMNIKLKRGFKNKMESGEPSTKCHITEIKGLPARELSTTNGSNNANNSEDRNNDEINVRIDNSSNKDCKKQLNLGSSSNKSHSVTMITPRDLINRTLEKLTNRKFPLEKQKTAVEEDNSKSCNKNNFVQTKQKPPVEENCSKNSNLSGEQLIEKIKKEEMRKELINRTLAKLTSGNLPKSQRKKTNEEIKTNDLSVGLSIQNNEEEEFKQNTLTLRTSIPRESKSRARIVIPKKQTRKRQIIEESVESSTPPEITLVEECKKQEESQKATLIHEENFQIKSRKAMPQSRSCKIKIQMDEPGSNICSTLKTSSLSQSNLKNKTTVQPKITSLEGKDKFCSTSEMVSPVKNNNRKSSQESPVKGGNLYIEKEQTNCVIDTAPQLQRGKHPKSEKPSSKVFDTRKLFKKAQLRKNRRGKPFGKRIRCKANKLKSNKPSVVSLNKNFKRTVEMDGKKSPSSKTVIASNESRSMTGINSKSDETIPEDKQEENCSNLSLIPSIDKVKYKEQIKAIPRVCLVDCKKIGLCASNKEIVSKNKFQEKNDPTLNYVTTTQNQLENQMMVDSGEYFTQLELSPSSKSLRFNSAPPKSMSSSPTEKMSRVEKGSKRNEHFIINDHDYGKLCSASPSLPARNLESCKKYLRFDNEPLKSLSTTEKKSRVEKGSETSEIIIIDDDEEEDDHDYGELCSTSLPANDKEGSKQCSVGLPQKSLSIDLKTKVSLGNNVINNRDCNSAPRKQFSPIKQTGSAFSLSTQVQEDNINYTSQFQLSSVPQPQNGTHNFITSNSIQKDNNCVPSKPQGGLPTRDLIQNKESKKGPFSSSAIKHSSNSIVKGHIPHNNLLNKGIPPLMTTEIPTRNQWNTTTPSNSYKIRLNQRLKLPPNLPISVPLPPENLPSTSGSKNYYFTPLFVVDGEKIVPINSSNASSYSIEKCTAPKPVQLLHHYKSSKSMDSKISHSQILIDSTTIKPLPALDIEAISKPLGASTFIASPKLNLINLNPSSSRINEKKALMSIKASSGLYKVSSTQPKSKNLEPTTKKKYEGSNESRTQNKLHQDVVHCSSSAQNNNESDQLTAPKRMKCQTHPESKYISTDQGGTKMPEPLTKRKIHSSREKLSNEYEHHEEVSVSSTYPSVECFESIPPKRGKYVQHDIKCPCKDISTNHMTVQPSERMSEVSSSSCNDPDTNYGNLGSFRTSIKEMSTSLSQNDIKQSYCQKSVKDTQGQLKDKEENHSTFSSIKNKTKENDPVSVFNNNENKQINNKNDILQNKNNKFKSIEKHVFTLDCKKSVTSTQKEMPVSFVKKRVKSKEEELEECLDGVPPFIQEVFKCENIRDGFDKRDLIFVLSLLPDIEEMTSTQKVIFQSRAIQIINDVFLNTKLQSFIKSIKT